MHSGVTESSVRCTNASLKQEKNKYFINYSKSFIVPYEKILVLFIFIQIYRIKDPRLPTLI